jgi:hypothetical protein
MLRVTFLSLCVSASAFASSPFPDAVKTHLSLTTVPGCQLCHTNGVGATGTVNTPFGKSLRGAGAVMTDTAKLNSALDTLAAAKTDSDGDGTDDITELKAGRDPNKADAPSDGGTGGGSATGGGAGGGGSEPLPLKYGCGASVVPELSVLAVLAFFAARRRRS